MIPESFKQDLLNRVDIVELIERHMPLKKGGANFMACCPFHSEKTPSFTVSPSKQFYHCFGCGAHGNAITFLMEYQGLGYVEAVKELAESVGMQLPELQPSAQPAASPDLYEIMERAARFYRESLKSSPRAIDYLKSRGLTGQVAARFGIGYAPDGWQTLQSVFTDYAGKAIKEAGLVIDAEGGRRYDRFRDRIMFPILNQRGSVIGLGGRVLDAGEPKYLNSPETPLFEKGRELYGLSQARNAIRAAGLAVVVEGYMDVVALSQHGIEYAVATLGTATSAAHVQKLFRQTDEIVFCFDGDAAGRRAAWHALEVALPSLADDKAVRFLFLPAEDDPDSYVRSKGAAAFASALSGARPLSELMLSELCGRVDMKTLEGRSRLIAEAKPLLKRLGAPALQLQLVRQLADAADMPAQDVARLTEIRIAAVPGQRRSAPAREGRSSLDNKLEREILGCLVVCPGLAKSLDRSLFDPTRPGDRAVLEVTAFLLERFAGQATPASYSLLLDHFAGDAQILQAIQNAQRWAEEHRVDEDGAEADFVPALEKRREKLEALRHAELSVLIRKEIASPDEVEEYRRLSHRRRPPGETGNAVLKSA